MLNQYAMMTLMNPSFAARMAEAEKRHHEQICKHQAENWDQYKTKFKKELVIRAKTYKPVSLWPDLPPKEMTAKYVKGSGILSPCGKWVFRNIIHPDVATLPICQGSRRGLVHFNGPVVIPSLFELHGSKQAVWMSLTPFEMFTQRQGLRLAKGRVFIGGLGLGWFLNEVCIKKSVKEVIVVEQDRELIMWLFPRIQAVYPAVSTKTTVFHGDALVDCYKHHNCNSYLFDIWQGYGDAAYDDKYNAIRQDIGICNRKTVWAWGESAYREK